MCCMVQDVDSVSLTAISRWDLVLRRCPCTRDFEATRVCLCVVWVKGTDVTWGRPVSAYVLSGLNI